MGFFQGYFDESGKHDKANVTVVSFCGFVDSDWSALEAQWNYLLRRYRLAELHIGKRDLDANAETIRIYRSFVHAIKQHVEHGFAVAVDVKGFKSARKMFREHYRDDPHYLAFYTVIRDVVKHVGCEPDPSVAVICDDEPSKACECYKMFDVMRQNNKQPENRRVLKSIAFADSSFYVQLQAADLFSWITRAEAMKKFFGIEYSLRELFTELQMSAREFKLDITSAFWDEVHMQNFTAPKLASKSKKR